MGKIFCSAIIPTVGRSSLSRAVESVLQQNIPEDDFEVLVINDSGKLLSWEKWQDSKKVQIVNTNQRERSVARNTGAAIAKGKYVHFLDDDDWLAPGAYLHLRELSRTNQQAKWLYGISQLVDRQNNPLIQLRHNLYGNCFIQVMSGEWIPLQASIIERETFMRIGGFDPLLTGPEDIDILRRILREEEIVETPNLVAYITMGNEGSTTDYAHHPHASRWAREIILNTPDAFPRMRSSADSLFSAGAGMFSTDFWKAILKPYASLTFEKGIREAKDSK
jgi:glycosyltransferase involved in cell wall biosynthesis